MTPLVSCVCPTYNRAPEYLWLLGEAVESFVRQDYPLESRELLIVNDCAEQTLVCHTPGVRVVNLPARVPSLGEKYNMAIGASRGELILPWEDDDISLPGRITQGVGMLKESMADYWNPLGYWFLPKQCSKGKCDKDSCEKPNCAMRKDHPIGVGHNCSIYRKTAWRMAGGYPQVSGAQDAGMDSKLKGSVKTIVGVDGKPSPPESWGYIYRWGVQPLHLSGRTPHDQFYAEVGAMPVVSGRFEIVPEWRQDYPVLAREALS